MNQQDLPFKCAAFKDCTVLARKLRAAPAWSHRVSFNVFKWTDTVVKEFDHLFSCVSRNNNNNNERKYKKKSNVYYLGPKDSVKKHNML